MKGLRIVENKLVSFGYSPHVLDIYEDEYRDRINIKITGMERTMRLSKLQAEKLMEWLWDRIVK